MSSFYAFDFIFDDIPSHKFDIKIITFEDGGLFNGVGSSDTRIITQRVLRKSKPYYLGRTQEPVLTFPLTFGSQNEIDAIDRDLISAWLFGRSEYKKLYILQDDLQNIYFNCFMTKPEPLYIGGINYAFTCQVVCDSPFAYGATKTITQENLSGAYFLNVFNGSSEDDYLYPTLEITANTTAVEYNTAGLIIINRTDEERMFRIEDFSIGDVITVNNDLQILSSALGERLMEKFSKKWLRFLPGNNRLVINPQEINSFTISYTERMKVGG